jgi:hypothetical protein
MSLADRLGLALANAVRIFSPIQPGSDGHWRLDTETGWFWTYLTPPIAVLCLAAFFLLANRSEWRLTAFLAGWFLLTCAPLVLFATVLFPRYALAASVPLLLAATRLITRVLSRTSRWPWNRSVRLVAVTTLLALLLAWPLAAVFRQSRDWQRQPLVAIDHSQYVSGWSAGWAIRRAVDFIRELSRKNPIVLVNIVGDVFPNMAARVYFEDDPRVHVYHLAWDGLAENLNGAWPHARELLVRHDHWQMAPTEWISVPRETVALGICTDPLYVLGTKVSWKNLQEGYERQVVVLARYTNPTPRGAGQTPESVVVFRLEN